MPIITLNVTDEQLAALNAMVDARGRGETVESLLLRRSGEPRIRNQIRQQDIAVRQEIKQADKLARQAERQAERQQKVAIRLQSRLDAMELPAPLK